VSDEKTNIPDPSEADTVRPEKTTGDGWKMPEPVFRQTSGYLPQGFEKRFAPAAAGSPPASEEADAGSVARAAAAPAVEPQPDILEELPPPDEPEQSKIPQKSKGGVGRILLILFGLLVVFVFILLFLAVVYYFYLAPAADSGNF
jgi:hypothetical protein